MYNYYRGQVTDLDGLFSDGLAACQGREWDRAVELLEQLVRRKPDYERGGQQAPKLLMNATRNQGHNVRLTRRIHTQIALLALAAAVVLGTVAIWASASNSRIQTATVSTQTGEFIYGISIADLKNSSKITELEFAWMKSYLSWGRIEPKRGEYDWADLDKGSERQKTTICNCCCE